jgi:hypothetical protein
MDDAYGWAWMPGTDWAPAWVAWRTDADYVGWAPLPPAAGWNETSGLASGDMGSVPTDAWCFVPRDHMMDASVGVQVTSVARNVTLLDGAQDETRFEVRGGHPFNVGIDINLFEKSIGRPVPRQRIVDVAAPARSDHRAEGGTVGYYRPAIHPPMPDRPPVPTPAMQRRAVPMPEPDMQRVRDDHQRKLESDLANEHTRLVNDQQAELRRQTDASATEALRQRQVVEQKAFEVHATRQRQVMGQRMQKQVVRPAKGNAKSKDNGNGKDKGRDNGGH